MRRVLIESPFSAPTAEETEINVQYARAAVRDALSKGDAPLASHLLYTQDGILNDDIPEERNWGIEAGVTWYEVAEACIVYTDRGISKGMTYGIARAEKMGIPVEYRQIPDFKPQAAANNNSQEEKSIIRSGFSKATGKAAKNKAPNPSI